MAAVHKTLLIISSLSFSLHAMEKEQSIKLNSSHDGATINSLNNQNDQRYYKINNLYLQTYSTLKNFNPNGKQSTADVIKIIAEINSLKSSNLGIKENDIGLFAHSQPSSIFYQFYQAPLYISVFYNKLKEYNAHLEKNNYTSPTLEEFNLYKKNESIIAAVNKSADFHLYIDIQKINKEKNILNNLPNTIAIDAFKQLMEDINKMLKTLPREIKTISEILYSDKK